MPTLPPNHTLLRRRRSDEAMPTHPRPRKLEARRASHDALDIFARKKYDMSSDHTILAKLGYGVNSNEEEEESPWAKLKRRKRTIKQSVELREMQTRAEVYSALTAQVTVIKESHWGRLKHRRNDIGEKGSRIARLPKQPMGYPWRPRPTAFKDKVIPPILLPSPFHPSEHDDNDENRLPPALAPRLTDIVNRLHQSKVKQTAHLKVRKDEVTRKATPVSSLEYGKYRKDMAQYDDFTTVKDCSYIRVPGRMKSKEEIDIDEIFH